MLIGTKVDLLPPGINPAEVAEWLQAAAAFKRISAVSVHLVGAWCPPCLPACLPGCLPSCLAACPVGGAAWRAFGCSCLGRRRSVPA